MNAHTSPVDTDRPLDNFTNCHVGIVAHLMALDRLPALLEPARQARTVAAETLKFFDEVVREHHAQEERELFPAVLASAVRGEERDRVQVMVDRLTQVGLLFCRVDASRVRHYQAMPASVRATAHFECRSCHRDSPLAGALQSGADDLQRAGHAALAALQALGYQGLSLDVSLRGVCADCAVPLAGARP